MGQILLVIGIFLCGFLMGAMLMHNRVKEGIDFAIDKTVTIFGAAIDKSSLTLEQKKELADLVVKNMKEFSND